MSILRRPLIPILILAVLIVGGLIVDRGRDREQNSLSGFFENQPTMVASRITGRVSRLLVKEGDVVRKGQPLIVFEAKSLASSAKAQAAAAEGARQQFLETKHGARREDIEKAEGVLREAEANYAKLVHGPLPEEIGQAKDRFESARQIYLKAVRGSRPEEIQAAKAAANVALARLRQAQRGLTAEERDELKARMDQATAAEVLASQDFNRMSVLYGQGAISKQQFDSSMSSLKQAQAHSADTAAAYKRAMEGTPAEELAQAEGGYRQAKAQYDLVAQGSRKEDIEAAKQDMAAAQESYSLALKGSRPEDIRAGQARVVEAQAALDELVSGNRPEEVARARAGEQEAALQARSQRENLGERTVFAPIDGVVDHLNVAAGDLVAANSPVLQITDPADIWIRVFLPEAQLSKVAVGDEADLAVDGISETLKGKVESINSRGEFTPANLQAPEERAKQVFGIRIRLLEGDPRVKPGMYATVQRVGRWP